MSVELGDFELRFVGVQVRLIDVERFEEVESRTLKLESFMAEVREEIRGALDRAIERVMRRDEFWMSFLSYGVPFLGKRMSC